MGSMHSLLRLKQSSMKSLRTNSRKKRQKKAASLDTEIVFAQLAFAEKTLASGFLEDRREKTMVTEMMYNSYGKEYKLTFEKNEYVVDGSLAIQILCEDPEDGFIEPFCTLTTNVGVTPSGENMAYIDVNNVPTDLINELFREKVIKDITMNVVKSGWVTYPEVEFDSEWLNAIG